MAVAVLFISLFLTTGCLADICQFCSCSGESNVVNCENRSPKLTSIPGPIPNTTKILKLGRNLLTEVNLTMLAALPQLEKLELNDNRIRTFTGVDQLPDTSALNTISVKNNQLECNCNLLKLRTWMEDKRVTLKQARCGPERQEVTSLDIQRFGDGTCPGTEQLLPPGPVSVKFISPYGATVSWLPPQGGSPVKMYKVSCVPDFGVVIIPHQVPGGGRLSAQLTGLVPGQTYTVVIESQNDVITSGSSTKRFTTIPLSVSSVLVKDISYNSATISWSPPGNQSQYSGFKLSPVAAHEGIEIRPSALNRDSRSAIVTGLQPFTGYLFSLVTMSGHASSTPVMVNFSTAKDPSLVRYHCAVCNNVTSDDQCPGQQCALGEGACQTHVLVVDREWKISKRCVTQSVCESNQKINGIGFTICCRGQREGSEYCNSFTNFTNWIEEVELEVITELKEGVAPDDGRFLTALTDVIYSTGHIYTIGEKTFDPVRREFTLNLTGSFLKRHISFFIDSLRTILIGHSRNGGQLYPYIKYNTTIVRPYNKTKEPVSCPLVVENEAGKTFTWGPAKAGETVEVVCPLDATSKATRTCELVGTEAKWGNPDYSPCDVEDSAWCPAQNLTTERGLFMWPETTAGTTSRVQCPLTTRNQTARRRCVKSEVTPFWAEADVTSCPMISDHATDTLKALTSMAVTRDNVVFMTSAMAEISQNATSISSEDLSLIGELVGNIVQSEIRFSETVQSKFGYRLVKTVSNLVNMESDQLQAAERANGTAKSLVLSMEKFAEDLVVHPAMPGIITHSDVSVASFVRLGPDDHVCLNIRPTHDNSLRKIEFLPSMEESSAGIDIPARALIQARKASFVVYNKNTFFQAMSDEWAGSPVGVVLSASVGRKVENLIDPVLITVKHQNKTANQTPRCVYWDFSASNGRGNWSDQGCHVTKSTQDSTECACNHMTNFALLMDVYGSGGELESKHHHILSVLSLVGCALSLLALSLTLISYILFRRKLLKTMPSKILLNLCLALTGVNAVFLGGTHYTVDDVICKIVAGLLHYFLLSSFCWMVVEAFYMYLSLVRVFQTYFYKLIWKFSIFAWGLPLVVVIVTISVNTNNYGLQNQKICWLPPLPFYVAFMVPLLVILVSNLIAFVMVLHQLRRVTSRKKVSRAESQETSTQMRAALSILVLLGLTWLFGFMAIGGATIVFAYLFAIFNTLQGLFIFIFYCVMKRDVQIAWMRSLVCCPDVEESTTSRSRYERENSGEWFRHQPILTTTVSYIPGTSQDGYPPCVSYNTSESLDEIDSSTPYRKSKGSIGTTFSSFQKDSIPVRKISETTSPNYNTKITSKGDGNNQRDDVVTNHGDDAIAPGNDVMSNVSKQPVQVEETDSTMV